MATSNNLTYRVTVRPVSDGTRQETSLHSPAGGLAPAGDASDPSPAFDPDFGFEGVFSLDTDGVLITANLQAIFDLMQEANQGTDISAVVTAIDAL